MRVSNFTGLVRLILIIYKHCLCLYKCWLFRNDQDLGNVFLEFLMRVRGFEGLVRVIHVMNKHLLYYYKCMQIRNDQDLGNDFL